MPAAILPHTLSCTADFSVDVYLVDGDELDGLWVFDMEDGTFSLVRSIVTPDESRQCLPRLEPCQPS